MKNNRQSKLVAGIFGTIAPDPQRIGRKTERRGIPGMPDAAPVHRLDMHAQNARSPIGSQFERTL
ncbi:hypothetical protein [Bradyrhizobium sp. USDA 4502]